MRAVGKVRSRAVGRGALGAVLMAAAVVGGVVPDVRAAVAPVVSISDPSIAEGGSLTFAVSRSETSADCAVFLQTAPGTAKNAEDYGGGSVVVQFIGLQVSVGVLVSTVADGFDEPDETVRLVASEPTFGTSLPPCTIGDGEGVGTILDQDAPATAEISIGDFETVEGFEASPELTRSNGTGVCQVTVEAIAGTAGAADFDARTETVTFAVGQTSLSWNLFTFFDTIDEPDESFTVRLSNPLGGCTLADDTGVVTLLDDDEPAVPTWSVADVSKAEGRSGDTKFAFTLTPSSSTAPACGYTATFRHVTTNDSDFEDDDLPWSTSGNTATSQIVEIVVEADKTLEPDETFDVTLAGSGPTPCTFGDGTAIGTILNDDQAPTISVSRVVKSEPDSGTSDMSFTVKLSNESYLPITVRFTTSDGTAVAGSDYRSVDTVVTFEPGKSSRTVKVPIVGDRVRERDERFTVTLSSATGATIATPTTYGEIRNDD